MPSVKQDCVCGSRIEIDADTINEMELHLSSFIDRHGPCLRLTHAEAEKRFNYDPKKDIEALKDALSMRPHQESGY